MKPHIRFDKGKNQLVLLDQRFLPSINQDYVCNSCSDLVYAIKNMVVRGAPAIGVSAAYGCVLAAMEHRNDAEWRKKLDISLKELEFARPTAVNLAWAVNRMKKGLDTLADINEVISLWQKKAEQIHFEDIEICRQIGLSGADVIKDGDTVLTHCNAGALATGGYGTALGVIRAAWEQGKKINVIADETRPLLQGARLTALELADEGIPVKVACDNAAAFLMQKKLVQVIITGADRIAGNGDTANKIGTLGLAIAAKYYGMPFYIAAPLSTIDGAAMTGSEIVIEERESCEVEFFDGKKIVPENVCAVNYAFDITPSDLITGIITEKGILKPPYEKSIGKIINGACNK